MKNTELRFGNLIFHNNKPIIIVGISIDGIDYKIENDNQIYVRNFVQPQRAWMLSHKVITNPDP